MLANTDKLAAEESAITLAKTFSCKEMFATRARVHENEMARHAGRYFGWMIFKPCI